MRKLHLRLEELHVDTFAATAGPGSERGTVHGNWDSVQYCNPWSDGNPCTYRDCHSLTNPGAACECFVTEVGATCGACYTTWETCEV